MANKKTRRQAGFFMGAARTTVRQNAAMPVWARPRISAWMSCVPS